jgi:hypothetical protein
MLEPASLARGEPCRMTSPLRLLSALLTAALLLPLVLLAGALPAGAVQTVAHGRGMMWLADGTSWVGDYELDDGNTGYCIDIEKPSPTGASLEYRDGSASGLFSSDDSARLAYISRRWGAPGDNVTAAAAQLATWSITGLAGHDMAYFAQRANGDADAVLERAQQMLAQTDGRRGASRGATATVQLDLAADRVTTDLVVDHLSGPLPPAAGSHTATMTLRGATFADGSRSRAVENGSTTQIRPDQKGATESVSVDVVYRDLPYGSSFRLGHNAGGSQSLLVRSPFPVEARASDSGRAPSSLPLRPIVQTASSAVVAVAGTAVHDTLDLGVHPESPTGGAWGVFASEAGGLAPIPVVISSRLLGPFTERPVRAPREPADAPVVCRFETEAASGPGRYVTPDCTLPETGYYVWTDSIDPARTPPQRGGDRLLGWTSDFGVASETTLVPATPSIATVASASTLAEPGCVSDTLEVSGLPSGLPSPVTVASTLLGPLAALPPEGTVPADWESFPVAGTVTTEVIDNGTHRTPCIEVNAPGAYYFIVHSEPSTPPASVADLTRRPSTAPEPVTDLTGATTFADAQAQAQASANDLAADPTLAMPPEAVADLAEITLDSTPLVPAFADRRVHATESVHLARHTPPTPPTHLVPPTSTPPAAAPPATQTPPPPAPPATLAATGASVPPLTIAATVLAIAAGLAALALTLRRRS